ncbi:SAC3/GANP/Nin1/mts3/eIF-3 p25 family-domain-containing protein [Lactarius pseudohatsudake]|nr:SAC3/GANP/Nin1/mts3/eIF-3 p25 family-domain-containing protein [Lactarius pseudohatsudake]
MESFSTYPRPHRGHDGNAPPGRRGTYRNKTWIAGDRSGSSTPFPPGHLGADATRWERGGTRGFGRGRGRGKGRSPRPDLEPSQHPASDASDQEDHADPGAANGVEAATIDEPVLETLEERERFYQELVKAREVERKRAIAEGKMDDPLVPKRLDEAITMVGTCADLCPRFERYRRERENNLFNWEVISGTKRVDHKRAVKMYERAAGDKTLPSDLRPPPVLKRTLDYLFRQLLPTEGFSPTFDFIRDRSRSVRNDFTMQHETGSLAMECHERCARFHILALHFERDRTGFSIAMEEQQLMNTLQSLKEFYEDQRDRYESPNELEMRIYHRLIHIRDQRERHDDIPPAILNHPVFLLTTKFRQHVQAKSSPITKVSPLVVHEEGMLQFAELAALLREQGNRVMVYLVACILERLFGKDTIEDIESIRAGIAIPDIIDGVLSDEAVAPADVTLDDYDEEEAFLREDGPLVEEFGEHSKPQPSTLKPSATDWLTNNFGVRPSPSVMFDTSAGASSSTSVLGTSSASAFSSSAPALAPPAPSTASTFPPGGASAFANLQTTQNVFGGGRNFGSGSAFGGPSASAFGTPSSAFGGSLPSTLNVAGGPTAPNPSLLPFGTSAPTPAVLNAEDQGAATSIFSSPFTRPAAAASHVHTTAVMSSTPPAFPSSQSAPSGFPTDRSHAGFGTGATPPTAVTSASAEKRDQLPASTLNPNVPAFSPGHPFGATPPKPPASTAKLFIPSSSLPAISTSTSSTPTRPILPPIDTSPLSSVRPSAPPPASQSAPFFNGIAKQPSLQDRLGRQSTVVDGFRPAQSADRPPTSEGLEAPQQPPPLKVQPISLPGTPTATAFNFPQKQKSGNNLFGWPSVQSISEPEILSPLVISAKNSLASLPAPSISRRPTAAELPAPAGLSRVSQDTTAAEPSSSKAPPKTRISPESPQDVEMASPTAAPLRNGKAKGKSKSKVPAEDLDARASTFARTSALVRGALKRWAAKASERAVYNDAVRRSDAYVGHKTTKKKRPDPRSGTDTEPEAKQAARRTRRRVSAKYTQPQTDAELARRLKENREQHERRWTAGTFLAALRAHVGNPAPFDYCLWLSLNPENDGTAIWLERKFDMPDSGAWASEHVFTIPLAPGADSRSPGLVIFECSPLHGLEDEIEKKYRVLDDCARLREVVEKFPEDRHFIPSVLFILWGEDEAETLPGDLHRMVGDYATKGVIGSHAIFSLSSKAKDLDEKFTEFLRLMDLDIAGGLVEILSRQEFLQVVIASWKDFALDWVARCYIDGEVDWVLFSKVFETLVKLMNALSLHFTTRLDESAVSNPLPEIPLDGVKSSSELYDAAFVWLERKDLRTASREFRTLLQSYRTSDADFPVHAFVDALYEMSVGCIEGSVKIDRGVRYPVPKRDIEETKREAESDVSEAAAQLRSVFLFHSRPKRPPPDDDDDDGASVLSMSPSSKRLKSTFGSFSTMDDFAHPGSHESMPPPSTAVSPSTSMTTIVNDDKPQKVVTVAMLRALSQSVLKKRPGS